MFVDLGSNPRAQPPPPAGERPSLVGFLDWQRHALELKCGGLDSASLARRAVQPLQSGGSPDEHQMDGDV